MKLRDLRQEHSKTIERIKELNGYQEKRDLTEAENSELEKLFSKGTDLKSQIEKREKIKTLELEKAGLDIPKSEQREYNFSNVIKGLVSGRFGGSYESEIMQELEKRGVKTQSGNGILIPLNEFAKTRKKTELRVVDNQSALVSDPIKPSEFVPALYEQSIMDRLGVKRISAKGRFTFPKSSGASAGWFSGDGGSDAGDSISESDPTYASVSVVPKYLGVLSGWTLKMIKDMAGDLSLESLLRQDLSMAMAEKLDEALIKGTGSGNQPAGLVTALEGLNPSRETDLDLSAMDAKWTLENLLDEKKNLKEAYKNNAMMPKWAINPGVEKEWEGTQKFAGANGDTLAMNGQAVGMQYAVTNHLKAASAVNTTEVLLGDFSEFIVITFDTIELTLGMINDDFKSGTQRLRAIGCFDFAMRRPEAFRKITIDRTA